MFFFSCFKKKIDSVGAELLHVLHRALDGDSPGHPHHSHLGHAPAVQPSAGSVSHAAYCTQINIFFASQIN